jgi:hypothetical protein
MKQMTLRAVLLPALALISLAQPQVTVKARGPFEVVFKHSTSACQPDDVPDDGARAFRDSSNTVHLIASGYTNLAMVGPSLDKVKRVCTPMYQDSKSADPSRFDDLGWLESFYTLDGSTIFGLVSHDYHPSRHHLTCGKSTAPASDTCWYSDVTFAVSHNGGKSFTSPPPGPGRLVAGAPYKFDPNHTSPAGAFVVSNIVSWPKSPYGKDAYFVFISVAADGAQKGGTCLLRTTTLNDPHSWRAWDGRDFTVSFIDPYTTPVFDPAKHVCEPIDHAHLGWAVRSLLKLESGGFIITMDGAFNTPAGEHIPAVYTSTSADLIHWSQPAVAQQFEPHDSGCTASSKHVLMYSYPALLDPNSPTRNFETVGNTAYIYFLRVRRCGGLDRDLVRLPVSIELHR